MNLRIFAAIMSFALPAVLAHDEGHGPKLTDQPQQGGVIASVVRAADARLGPKATLIYKAELARLEDGSVRVYLYDDHMAPLPLTNFGESAKAIVIVTRKGKVSETPFTLKKGTDSFEGKLPAINRKPYNIDINFQEG